MLSSEKGVGAVAGVASDAGAKSIFGFELIFDAGRVAAGRSKNTQSIRANHDGIKIAGVARARERMYIFERFNPRRQTYGNLLYYSLRFANTNAQFLTLLSNRYFFDVKASLQNINELLIRKCVKQYSSIDLTI